MKIDQKHLLILEAGRTDGNNFYLQGQLDRKDYTKVNEVLEACGGKWNRKAKAHVFPIDAAEAIDQVLTSGEVLTVKDVRDQFQFFPTPKPIVDMMIEAAEIDRPGLLALEPSAGRGAILDGLVEAGADFHVYELMPENAAYLREKGYQVAGGDFLSVTSRPIYDRIVMNPPFARQADIKHVKWALTMLKPGGILVAIMSAGVMYRSDRLSTEFRTFVENLGGIFTELPEGAFKESGTNVKTVLLKVCV